MRPKRLERLVASVPSTIDERERARPGRLHRGFAALRSRHPGASRPGRARPGHRRGEPDTALDLACELDDLERIQPRVDAWLNAYVSALIDKRTPTETFGEGPA